MGRVGRYKAKTQRKKAFAAHGVLYRQVLASLSRPVSGRFVPGFRWGRFVLGVRVWTWGEGAVRSELLRLRLRGAGGH
eukprot:3701102-Rhodomonas_salina.1